MADDVSEQEKLFRAAVENSELPHLYFNGFTNAMGSGDITIILQQSGHVVGVLNTSFTVAKTLAQKLQELIANLEEASGNRIMTIEEIGQHMKKESSDGNSE